MAFVLVQHLDPNRESMLQEILSRSTSMPVREVVSGMKVLPNSVFIMPSNASLEVVDGHLQLLPHRPVPGTPMPIDHFFRSLAERYGNCAIGVVLSGSLSDGALGLRAIKAEGGVTFAQEEESAKFRDMPRAAIAAGSVDFVYPPDGIALELARMGRHPYLRSVTAGEAETNVDPVGHQKVLAMLRVATGVDFALYRQSTIRRRIARRLALKKIESVRDYVEYLREHPAELNALHEDLLIRVTRFFRDPEVFQTLKSAVFSHILKDRPADDPLRIWVPGCATGEEVYSIAITLFEAIQEAAVNPTVQIFGTDISETAVQKARAGIFLENHMVDLSPERMTRFFVKVEGGFQISKAIRDVCVFARQNVAGDPPFSGLDLISCRNVLIYLEPVLQKQVIPLFHYALKPGGFLLLGASEAIEAFGDLFVAVDRRQRIFSKRPGSVRQRMDLAPRRQAAVGGRSPGPGKLDLSAVDLQREADRVVLDRYAPAGVLVNESLQILQFRGRTSPYLEAAPGTASFNVLKMAREGLLVDLRSAILQAKKTDIRVRKEDLHVRHDGTFRRVNLEVLPIKEPSGGRYFLVLFEEAPEKRRRPPTEAAPRRGSAAAASRGRDAQYATIARLEQELTATKEYLQAIIEGQETSNEEMVSTNEELQSANEELQSTNEELETAKEELQATNEELTTVNEELANRNAEVSQANSDLWNLTTGIRIPVVMVAADGRIRRFTPEAERLLNLLPTDVGRPIGDIRTPLKGLDLAEVTREVVATVTAKEEEIQDEQGNWFLIRVRPYRTLDNRVDGAVLSLVDIDMKRSLEEIHRARDYAEALVETIQESLLILDENLRIRTANDSFYRTFGGSAAQTQGKPLFQLPEWRAQEPVLRRKLESVLTDTEPLADFEVELEFETLGPKALCCNARRVRLPGEPAPLLLLAMEDVTKRKTAERQLRFSETRYRLLFETSREGIWLLDAGTGEILEVNEQIVRTLGFSAEELRGKTPWELDLYDDNAAARQRFEKLRRKGSSHDTELRMKAKQGTWIAIEAVSNVYQAESVRVIQCSMRDVSDRHRLQEELRQVQKLESIGRLAGGIAHDFNNILNIISAHGALLSRRKPEGAKEKESLDAIEKAVRRGSAVVRQLLTFARKSEISFEQVDVNAIVEEVAKMLEETFPKSVTIELDLDPDIRAVHADPNQIHQAVLNLCVNARDAMPDGGVLRLETNVLPGAELRAHLPEADGERYVGITVSDCGTGMSAETRRRLFEPFFTTKEPGSGVGLGLAVVYGVVNSHGGLIDVDTRPGKGTTFQLYFPVSIEGGEPLKKLTAVAGETKGGKETILLVEDEEALLQAVRELLEGEGYSVLAARDGVEAVRLYDENAQQVAAVVADLGLPRLGGWEAYLKMRERDPKIRCIVVSGNLDSVKRAEMHRAGIRASLRKPFAATEVLNTVRRVLDAP